MLEMRLMFGAPWCLVAAKSGYIEIYQQDRGKAIV